MGFQSREGLLWAALLGLTLLGARFLEPALPRACPRPPLVVDDCDGERDDGAPPCHRTPPPPRIVFPGGASE